LIWVKQVAATQSNTCCARKADITVSIVERSDRLTLFGRVAVSTRLFVT